MKKYAADIVTEFRIVLSIILLFLPVLSTSFLIMYSACGFTDMIDGTIARKTNSVSAFGSKLDTVADFIFFSAVIYKLFPAINIPKRISIWIIFVAAVKLISILIGLYNKRTLVVHHTIMNKITGMLLFLLPFTLKLIELKYSGIVICIIATVSSIQEMYYSLKNTEIGLFNH